MKRTTTTREYDAEGNLTREVIEETEHADAPTWPVCTCSPTPTYAVRYCPVHGYSYPLTWTSVSTTTSPHTYTINAATLS